MVGSGVGGDVARIRCRISVAAGYDHGVFSDRQGVDLVTDDRSAAGGSQIAFHGAKDLADEVVLSPFLWILKAFEYNAVAEHLRSMPHD